MNYFALCLVFPLFAIGEGLMDPRTRMNRPHVETYWESWEEGKEDFASNLIDVPVSPIGTFIVLFITEPKTREVDYYQIKFEGIILCQTACGSCEESWRWTRTA